MSQTSLLPQLDGSRGTVAAGGAASGGPLPDDDQPPAGHRRFLVIAGIVVGAVILATVGYLMLHHKATPPSVADVPHGTPAGQAHHRAAAGSPAAPAAGPPTRRLPGRAAAAVVRDPFKPLVVPPKVPVSGTGSTGTGVAGGTTTGGGTTSTGTTGSLPGTTVPVVTPTVPGGTTPGVPSPIRGTPKWVQLLSVHGTRSATFELGYSHHRTRTMTVRAPRATAATGTTFGRVLALIAVHGHAVTVQVGDATPVDLTSGVAHIV